MTYNPVSGGGYSPPAQSQQSGAQSPGGQSDLNPYGDGKCPECGIDLDTVDPKKHAVAHWGDSPIPVDPQTARQTLLARQRRAILTGDQPPDR